MSAGDFLLLVGVLCLVTPLLVIPRDKGEEPMEAFERWLFNAPLKAVFLLRAVILSGQVFLAFGVILKSVGK